jgi:hypothetical protein
MYLFSAAILCALASAASAATIGLHFQTGGDVGGTNGAHLAPTDVAGAGAYAQVNWNNLAGALGTNVTLMDSSGGASGVSANWSAPNTWSQSGNSTASVGTPDANLMNPYLDNNGNANVAISGSYNMYSTTTPANNNRNWPLVYLTNLTAWLSGQGAAAYDIVIYFDGDNAGGRVGEYWAVNASGDPTALTLGVDASTHIFGCDLNNFIGNAVYSEVSAAIQTGAFPNVSGGIFAEFGNSPGNYTVIKSLTNDTVLLRTQRFNSRAPINAIQIIPRITVLPASFDALTDVRVFPGGKTRLAPIVSGGTPMTFQWQKNGVNLSDGGNIAGSSTSALTISSVGGGDVASYSLVVTNPLGVVTSAPMALTLLSVVGNSYPEKILTNAPYAYWRFNDSGDPSTNFAMAVDNAGGFHAIYGRASQNGYGGTPGPQPGDFPGFESTNTALLSANNARQTYALARPLNLNTNTATFCAWIYPLAAQNGFTALVAARNGSDVASFGFGNNNNLGYTWNSNNAATYNFVSGLVPLTNAWSLVALAISPSNAVLYLYNTNGQLSATNSITHSNEGWSGLTFIGCDGQGASIASPQGRSFAGYIDEVAVFSRTLAATEINNLYKKALGLNAILPVVSIQPKSLALLQGRTARFNITASGDAPLTYQWRRNGSNLSNGGNISGANTPALTINNVTIAPDAADYDIVVANIAGSATSSAATLSVVVSNSAVVPYESKLRQLNPIAYWRLNEANGSQYSYDYWGGNIATNENVNLGIAGPVAPDFTGLENTNTAGGYDGLMADTATTESFMNNRAQFSIIGWFNASNTVPQRVGLFGQNDVCEFGFHGLGPDSFAQIGIWTPRAAAFLNQTNITTNVWYLVAAVGDGTNVSLTLVSTNGGGGFQVLQASTPHAATTNYGISPFPFRIGGGGVLDTTGNFFNGSIDEVAIFDRALSSSELSELFGAALTGGLLPPGISSSPGSLMLYAGRTATFHVGAVGTSLQYTWRKNGVSVSNGGNLSGATTDTLTITNVSGANQGGYDVIVSNAGGSVTSSPPAVLTVVTPTPGSYEATLLTYNPIAYYRLNSTNDPSTGSEVNLELWGGHNGLYGVGSQNAFNGILGPQPPLFGFETNNGGLGMLMETTNSFATAPIGTLSTNAVTFTMWIQPAGTFDDFSGLMMTRGGGAPGGFGFTTGGQLGYTWNNDSGATWGFASGLVPPMGAWSFVGLVVEPTQATFYLYSASGLTTATNVLAHNAEVFGNNWQIGHDNVGNPTNRTFNGRIDEVAVFNYALTPGPMGSLYAAGGPPLVSLAIQQSGPNIVLTWPQGVLLEANNVTGPWSTNGAASPYTTAPSAAKKFYKVQVR